MLIHADCLEALRHLPDNSVDSVVTDPPYGLSFMGKKWDYDVPSVDIWRECLRVLKPGGHLLSFAGSRTYHRIACAIEDAGFEIRDQIMWVYGSGFPKSLNIGKAIDKMQGNEREVVGSEMVDIGIQSGSMHANRESRVVERDITIGNSGWDGWGTALKPAHEPICVARKPISEPSVAANVLKWGTGAINIDGCRVEYDGDADKDSMYRPESRGGLPNEFNACKVIQSKPHTQGRFPANFIHDGSDEVLELFPETKSGLMKQHIEGGNFNVFSKQYPRDVETIGDSGSAARFFYCAKASKAERGENNIHPTVKPIALMRYLVRLVTPPNGTVLDPFLGSGTTAIAAVLEGFDWIGIEREAEYCDIAEARIAAAKPEQLEMAL